MIKTLISMGVLGVFALMFMDSSRKSLTYNSKVQKASDRKLLRYVLSQNLSCKHTFNNTYNLDCYDAKYSDILIKDYTGANIQDSDGKVLGTKVVAKCVNNSLRFDISENSSKHKWLFDSTLKNKCKNNFKSNTITHENPYVMAALEVDARSGRVVHRMLNGAPSNAFIFHDVPNLPSLGNCDKKAGVYNLGGRNYRLSSCEESKNFHKIDTDSPLAQYSVWDRVFGIECNRNNGYYLASCSTVTTSSPDLYVSPKGMGCFSNDYTRPYTHNGETYHELVSGVLIISCLKD